MFNFTHIPLTGPKVYQSMVERKKRAKKPGRIADITDGQAYKALDSTLKDPLARERSVSVVLNTDGVTVFKSTNYSIWPILLMVNELPFSERYIL